MAVIYSALAKTNRMTAVRDLIDAATGDGRIEIGTTGMATVLAQITLDAVCGTVSGPVLTFSGFPKSDLSANASGTAAEARIVDGAGVSVITGLTVGVSGADINLDSVTVAVNQKVTLNSASLTHA